MIGKKNLLSSLTVKELEEELEARVSGGTGENPTHIVDFQSSRGMKVDLQCISTWELTEALVHRAWETRAVWFFDNRMDIYKVRDKDIKQNAACVVAVTLNTNLETDGDGFWKLRVSHFGQSLGLSKKERFWGQPASAGPMWTGFLVKEDIVATAAHVTIGKNVKDLRFVFGYMMRKDGTPVTRFSDDDIYSGDEIIKRVYEGENAKPDWTLVKLDRPVRDREPAKPYKNRLYRGQAVYTIGHPNGLPLKAAPGATISNINPHCFVSNLDVFGGNSGSPVFCGDTHKVIGMVVRGDGEDFKRTKHGLVSAVYPDFELTARGSQSTRITEFGIYSL